MSDEITLTPAEQDEKDDLEYTQAFAEANGEKAPEASTDPDPAGVAGEGDGEPSKKDPDPAEAVAPADKGKASDDTPNGENDPYAWIDDLPEDVREQAKALRHKYVSTTGRISAYQSRVDAAEAELAAREAVAVRRQTPSPSTEPKEDKELSPQLKEFVEKYPQLASSIRELIASESTDVTKVIDEKLSPLTEEAALEKARKARQQLAAGASEIFNTPETGVHYRDVINSELYREHFLKSQPREFRELATTTSDPETALMVMRQFVVFAEDYAKREGIVNDDGKPTSKADTTKARRSAVKDTAGTPNPRTAVTDPLESGSYEDEFARLNAKKP